MLTLTLAVFSVVLCVSAQSQPTGGQCPSGVALVRSAGDPTNQALSSQESSYISTRASSVLPAAWQAYLANVNAAASASAALPSYVSSILANTPNQPRLAIAVSGGGHRAALFGAGVLSAFDGRTTPTSGVGGLLQSATYLSGLSGGAWLVISLSQANFPTIPDLIFPPNGSAYGGFLAQFDLTNPGPTPIDTLNYLKALLAESRDNAGFPITITNLWARALARHFVNGTTAQDILSQGQHGAGILFSGIASLPAFQSHTLPFPIIVADSINDNQNTSQIVPGNTVPLTNEIWEFNVFETGSFDPMLGSFTPTSLLGSTNSSVCITGFDQAAYIAGVSSNIFNSFNITASLDSSPIGPLIKLLDAALPPQPVRLDSAAVPNPFRGVNPGSFLGSNQEFVTLVDGGSDGQVLPLQPLLVRARNVDVIIAIDASADTPDNFSNGTDLINTARRAQLFGSQYPFPPIPATADIFVDQGLTTRPTFFGCNESSPTPLVVYMANGRPGASIAGTGGEAPLTNSSTARTVYSDDDIRAILDQASREAKAGISTTTNDTTTPPPLSTCVACAVVDRARAKANAQREGVCVQCFERYCWNGEGGAVGAGAGPAGGGGATGAGAGKKNGAGSVRAGAGAGAGSVWVVVGVGAVLVGLAGSV